jgi:hypothetical protein
VGLEELRPWLRRIEAMPEARERESPLTICVPVMPIGVGEDHRANSSQSVDQEPSIAELRDRAGALSELGVDWVSLPAPRARSLDEYLDLLQGRYGGLLG